MPSMIIATWKPAFPEVCRQIELLIGGASAEDVVEKVCMFVEDDEGDNTVGYGGLPNSSGIVELDAAFMEGRNYTIGGVAALVGYKNPVCVARKVMTDTPHNLLVGGGAAEFAAKINAIRKFMLNEAALKWYMERVITDSHLLGHDTIGAIALDTTGHMAVATSTSGISNKMPGRVSDSVLPGCGFMVDDNIGGAVATGVGEEIMKGVLSMRAVDYMRGGMHPQNAANQVISDINLRIKGLKNMAVLVADNKGNYGGCANHMDFTASIAVQGSQPIILDMNHI